MQNCPFCRPDISRVTLWESAHYRVVADEFPVCAGHVLLLTKEHFSSHMSAPIEWEPEFETAQDCVRQFLLGTFGRVFFVENGGGKWQTVSHAHLHGLPLSVAVPQEGHGLSLISGWQDVRRALEQRGYYVYAEAINGRYLISDDEYESLRKLGRAQLVSQTEAQIDPTTGKLVRLGSETVLRTREFWRNWSHNKGGVTQT